MTTIILLTKEDIETTPIGLHYQVTTKSGVAINFTPDAIDELIADIKSIREIQAKENIQKPTNQ